MNIHRYKKFNESRGGERVSEDHEDVAFVKEVFSELVDDFPINKSKIWGYRKYGNDKDTTIRCMLYFEGTTLELYKPSISIIPELPKISKTIETIQKIHKTISDMVQIIEGYGLTCEKYSINPPNSEHDLYISIDFLRTDDPLTK